MVDKVILLFKNIHDVIRSEKLIKSKGFDYQIVPVPSNISSECGMCIEVKSTDSLDIYKTLTLNNINSRVHKQ